MDIFHEKKVKLNIMLVINHFIGALASPQTNCAAFIAGKDFCVVRFCTVLIFRLGSNCGLAALTFVFPIYITESCQSLPLCADGNLAAHFFLNI